MSNFVTTIRPYVELLYFISGIVLAIVACIGLQQIRLLKYEHIVAPRTARYSHRYRRATTDASPPGAAWEPA